MPVAKSPGGPNNYPHMGSDTGGRTATSLYRVIASAKRLTLYLVKRLESLGHEVTLSPIVRAA